ncbi:MAG: RidA family protein [Dehalococcoidia bacterium]|jgi:2-iminobutanoate/2-iminopropanoate deaminase
MEKKAHVVEFLSRKGPYSHAVEAGGLIFLSGMLPIDGEKNIQIIDNVGKATELCLNNIKRLLEQLGSDMGRMVKVTVFLKDMASFDEMNGVYKTFFTEKPPARTCIAVKDLPGGFPIEIEAVAIK